MAQVNGHTLTRPLMTAILSHPETKELSIVTVFIYIGFFMQWQLNLVVTVASSNFENFNFAS